MCKVLGTIIFKGIIDPRALSEYLSWTKPLIAISHVFIACFGLIRHQPDCHRAIMLIHPSTPSILPIYPSMTTRSPASLISGKMSDCTKPEKRGGFALVIALSLMAFVLLLILSMATLVRVETSSAENSRSKVQSEQNALLALQVALGQLQSLAGADQRVSARADILTDLSTSSGAPDPEKKYLTGIWSTEPVADGTGSIEKLGWLVSGAPDISTSPNWHQNAWTGDTILMVSDKTADTNVTAGDPNDLEVKAGKLVVEDQAGTEVGHYAYWVGDEGVKAKINMIESEDELETNPTDEAEFYRLHAVQRVDPAVLESGSGLDYEDAVDRSALQRVFTRGLFDLIDETDSSSSPKFLQSGFHDYTLSSKGLLTNALEGGLKTDLTRGLDDQPLSGKLYDDSGDDKPAPNWETISSYYNLDTEVTGNQIVRAQTDTEHGVNPVVLGADMFHGLYFDSTGMPADSYQLNAILWTAVVMHNPYDVALAPTDYIIESDNIPEALDSSPAGGKKYRFKIWTGSDTNSSNLHNHQFSIPESIEAATGEKKRFIRYQTSEPIGFEPGEVKVLSTQLPANFKVDGQYTYADMPDEAKVMTPGYQESLGFLAVPLTAQTTGGIGANGVFTTADLFTADIDGDLQPNWIEMFASAYVSLKVYAIQDGNEEYVGGLTTAGLTLNGGSSAFREIITDQPIGLQGAACRILLPRSSGGYGYRLLADFNYRGLMDPSLVEYQIGETSPNKKQYMAVPPSIWSGGVAWDGGSVNAHTSAIQYDVSNGYNAYSGRSINDDGMSENVFFSVPTKKIFSLGDLRHVNLRKDRYQDSDVYGEVDASIPSYVIGNSWASHFMPLDEADYTYRVNEVLWDQYYFSSIPADTTDWDEHFPNSRIITNDFNPNDSVQESAIMERDEAAEYLAVDGAFNVNSTSIEAWRALLGGLSDIVDDPDVGSEKLQNIFPRITNWATEDYQSGDISGDDITEIPRMWSGFRSLTDEEIDALAEEIVEQVKLRGPFASLASFVNRTLVDLDPVASPDPAPGGNSRLRVLVDQHDTRLKGTLQAAIDNVDVNNDGLPDINEDLRQADFDNSLGLSLPPSFVGVGAPLGIIDSQAQRSFAVSTTSPPSIRPSYRENARGLFSTDAPGFLSQIDILGALAPLLTVRSDTFTIRSYGDSVNPVTGDVIRSWCEAVVQRTTEPLDTAAPADGRVFKVVSFRWLSDDEV